MLEEQNTIRTVLRSEITWLISFIVCVMGFVTTVIMPLQKVQIQLAQIQTELQSNNSKNLQMETRLNKLELNNARIEQIISSIIK